MSQSLVEIIVEKPVYIIRVNGNTIGSVRQHDEKQGFIYSCGMHGLVHHYTADELRYIADAIDNANKVQK